MSEGASTSADARIDYAALAWRGRVGILLGALSMSVVFLAVTFVMPITYQAESTIIPAPSHDASSILSQLGANLADLGLRAAGSADYSPMYSEIVRSHRILGELLARSYKTDRSDQTVPLIDMVQPNGQAAKRQELAFRRLRGDVDAVLDNRTGVLTIRVRARRPEVAAAVANTLDTLLQQFMLHSMSTQAGENRRFVEGRLSEVGQTLAHAEAALLDFRERNVRIGNSPRLLLDEGRLTRTLREQEEIYLTLQRQYELAKLEELRDVPTLSILDPAVRPISKYSPKRIMLSAFGFLTGGFTAFAALVMRTSRSPVQV